MSNQKVPHYLILIKGKEEGEVFIMATEDLMVHGFETLKQTKDYFLESYGNAHSRSYEGSMSACVHFMQFQPHIVRFESLDDIKNRIAAEDPHVHSLTSIAGRMLGISCRKEAYKIWKESESAPLIK
jgi:hypothetical protein